MVAVNYHYSHLILDHPHVTCFCK